ncbi:7109_t:CDS:2 [Cetraspora pellucida]|uniref:7109_t:CDS:1 n=1 Tax=Cetraspora pellucida TaxID=1433469 RepID=A0A9N9JRG0_9GLOM|nr:7109_t:CDS:2 [Cetraspora pellucida]
MLPPSFNTFTSHKELLTYVQFFAKSQSYAITIKEQVKQMFAAGSCPRQILSTIQQNDSSSLKASNATEDLLLSSCTGILRLTIGIPCSHIINEHLMTGQALQQTNFHEYGWIQDHYLEFLKPIYPTNNNSANFQPLLQSLAQMFQFWPPHQ